MDSSQRDWSWLLEEIPNSILDNLVSFYDYARFSAVCKQWSSVAKHRRRRFMKLSDRQLPLLVIPSKHNRKNERSLYNVMDGKIYDFQLPLKDNSRRYCGSSHGWLATVDKNMIITLRNPFLNRTIRLPPIMEAWKTNFMPEFDVSRVVLSNDPSLSSDNNYEVAAISSMNRTLQILKSGSKTWTCIDRKMDLIQEVIYYNNTLLAVDLFGGLVRIDTDNNSCLVLVTREKFTIPNEHRLGSVYLVKSSEGTLMMIRRIMEEFDDSNYKSRTKKFKVYKLSHRSQYGEAEWVEIESLGDDAVFVGGNQSLCVPASGFPGCKPNSIYFHDDDVSYFGRSYYFQSYDVCSFNLEDGSISSYYLYDQRTKPSAPSIWIVPTLR